MKLIVLSLIYAIVVLANHGIATEFQRQLLQRTNELLGNNGEFCVYADLPETENKVIVCGNPVEPTASSYTTMAERPVQLTRNPGRDENMSPDDQRILIRAKKDVSSNDKKLCVYADVSKTGKKIIVCGDPTPPTLDMLKSMKSAAEKQERQVEERKLIERCLCSLKKPTPPISVYLQQPPVEHNEHIPFVQPVQYVQPQIQYVQPQVHYLQPQVHYVQPQISYVHPPQVHYEHPQVAYEQIVLQKPQLCDLHQRSMKGNAGHYGGYGNYGGYNGYGINSGYGDYGGYGGQSSSYGGYGSYSGYGGGYSNGYYGQSSPDEYPMLLRFVENDQFVNNVPVLRSVQENMVPIDETTMARKGFGGFRTAMRPTPIFLPLLRNSVADDLYVSNLSPPQSLEAVPQFLRIPVQRSEGLSFDDYRPQPQQMQYYSRPEYAVQPNAEMYDGLSKNVEESPITIEQQPVPQSDQSKSSVKKVTNDMASKS